MNRLNRIHLFMLWICLISVSIILPVSTAYAASVHKGWEIDIRDIPDDNLHLFINGIEWDGEAIRYEGKPITIDTSLIQDKYNVGVYEGYPLVNGVDYSVSVTGKSVRKKEIITPMCIYTESVKPGKRKVIYPGIDEAYYLENGKSEKAVYPGFIIDCGDYVLINDIRYSKAPEEYVSEDHFFCSECKKAKRGISDRTGVLEADANELYALKFPEIFNFKENLSSVLPNILRGDESAKYHEANCENNGRLCWYGNYDISIIREQLVSVKKEDRNVIQNQYIINGPGKYTLTVTATGEKSPVRHRSCLIEDYVGTKTITFEVVDDKDAVSGTIKSGKGKASKNIPGGKSSKKKQTIQVRSKTVKLKKAKVWKKRQNIKRAKAFTIKKAQGAVTFKKLSGSKKISISRNGKISVRKGTKKGVYKIKVRVTASGNKEYYSGSKEVTVRIKIVA